MKKLSVFVVLALLMGVVVMTASAGAFTYTSGIQVQNLSGTEANVSVAYINKDGSIDATVPGTVPANGSVTYFPIGASDGFDGSVVISADQPVAAISNVLGSGASNAAASYVGASAGGSPVNLPLLMSGNSGYNTWFNVQNTGGVAATVNVAYSDGTTAGPVSIEPGAAALFDQAAETHTAKVFSGVVTSDQPVAVSVIEESSTIMFAYSGFISGSPEPVMPLINANNGGYVTGVQVQNTGATATEVTISYTASPGLGTDCTETQTIPGESSATFALAAFGGASPGTDTCVDGARFVGSAKVTANSQGHDLTVIVNQLGAGTGEAYGGFDAAAASDTVVMPLIMDRNGGFFTGFNVQNVGSDSTTVDCTFTGTSYTVSATLAAGEALNDLQGDKIAVSYVGSATCVASGGTDNMIVGVVNELGTSGDSFLVYEGIND